MSKFETLFGGLSVDEFMRDYWQKKPLFVKQALPGFQSYLSGDELAGLALEEEVESRLVIEKDGTEPWQVIHGPLQESAFSGLPESHWTLLVQEVNRHLPEVAGLLSHFDFIPAWRVDDVMISYAEDQGSVGPHTDNYDVFLIQAEGKRRWQVSSQQVTEDDLIPGIAMRIMRQFDAEQEWLLEPGDMLYLPPNVPHYGVAQGNCMTYSVGFRAPTSIGMWQHYQEYIGQLVSEFFYQDPDLKATSRPGLIDNQARDRIREIIHSMPQADDLIDDWFGRFITEPMRGSGPYLPDKPMNALDFEQAMEEQGVCYRSEDTRFAYYDNEDGFRLYINGDVYDESGLTKELAVLIADHRQFNADMLAPFVADSKGELLADFYNRGYLYFLDGDDAED